MVCFAKIIRYFGPSKRGRAIKCEPVEIFDEPAVLRDEIFLGGEKKIINFGVVVVR